MHSAAFRKFKKHGAARGAQTDRSRELVGVHGALEDAPVTPADGERCE